GQVENAYIRAVDKTGKEIAKYTLSGTEYNGMCTLVFGEVYRKDSTWKFRATGDAYPADSFVEQLKQYL
ncbi:MAG: tellurium resistance protein TerX, partial [Chitinophagia bacterium]|nr:tellurium resistance protein TerX [Chitinophagia bacterium]